jgi:hypothetical protein
MADTTSFKKVYEAYFRKSLDREFDVWYDFICKADESILKEALDTLEEVYTSKKQGGFRTEAPTFPEVKREYWNLVYKRDGSTKKFCMDECSECDGFGAVRVVVARESNGKRRCLDPKRPEAISANDLAIFNTECTYAFCVPKEKRGSWHGWSLKSMENDCRVFISVCNAMYQRDVLKIEPEPVDFCKLPQVEVSCPSCGSRMKINQVPDGFEEEFGSMPDRIICDICHKGGKAHA